MSQLGCEFWVTVETKGSPSRKMRENGGVPAERELKIPFKGDFDHTCAAPGLQKTVFHMLAMLTT